MNRLAKWEYDTNRCDATVLNIQKFEEDKLEGRETGSGTGDPNVSWSLSYILVLLTKNVTSFSSLDSSEPVF
jgi:hypothetical protein